MKEITRKWRCRQAGWNYDVEVEDSVVFSSAEDVDMLSPIQQKAEAEGKWAFRHQGVVYTVLNRMEVDEFEPKKERKVGLPEYYYACNEEAGHYFNCGYGAGGDCYCGKFNVDAGHARNCTWADPDNHAEYCSCGAVPPRPIIWLRIKLMEIKSRREAEARREAAANDPIPF